MGDILIQSLGRKLPAMLHKIIRTQLPDVVAKSDGKADAGQNRNLNERQSLENGSHCAHKAQGHPQGTACAVPATATAKTHRNSAEMTAKAIRLKALNISSINSDACEPPRLVPQPIPDRERCPEYAFWHRSQDFRSRGKVRLAHDCPPCRCRGYSLLCAHVSYTIENKEKTYACQ